jgi:uncharacterized membrane protein YdbT with pleckstrin-like domain
VRDRRGGAELLTIQHHPVLLVRRAWRPGALILIAAVLVVAIATNPAGMGLGGIWLGIAAGVFVVGGVWAAIAYLLWSNHRLYLTPTRLIEVSGIIGISQERRELRLERLQSVELDVRNLLLRWTGAADVIISVTGTGSLRFAAAREPLLVRDGILARLDERHRIHEEVDDTSVRDSVEELLGLDPPPLLPEEAAAPRPAQARRRFRLPQSSPVYFGRRVGGVAWRRHPWFLVRACLGPGIIMLLGVALPFGLDRLGLLIIINYAGFFSLFLIIAALAWAWWLWVDWRNDHYVVTPDRLIEIEQLPLGLRQQFTEAALDRVEDIRYRIPNPLASLLNYGDVIVRTASADEPFTFRGIARPRQLAAQIDRYVTALQIGAEQARHDAMRAEFARWLTTYDEVSSEAQAREEQQDAEETVPERRIIPRGLRRPQSHE